MNHQDSDPRAIKIDAQSSTTNQQQEPEKGGEYYAVTNYDFIVEVIKQAPEGASTAVCTKPGDPNQGGGWLAEQYNGNNDLPASNNNYLNCSSFHHPEDRDFNVKKENFFALNFLLFDDLGTKIPEEKLAGITLTSKIETSPGNYQATIALTEPITDIAQAERLVKVLTDSRYSDPGAGGVSRWARLPVAINGKEKYKIDGNPFQCRLVKWNPDQSYTIDEIYNLLQLGLEPKKRKTVASIVTREHTEADNIFIPAADENPVLTALKERGLYKAQIEPGKHDISCPWCKEHTDQLDTGAAYWEPDDKYPYGGYRCLHSHGDKYRLKELLEELNLTHAKAVNRATIRVVQGDLHRVVDVAERELARNGEHYQAGGLIVSISINPSDGNPSINPTNGPMLTRTLAGIVSWEKYDRRSADWIRSDPPSRYVSILNDSKEYKHLPVLAGLARQPYFRESDSELLLTAGYDEKSGIYGVFNPEAFNVPEPTKENAEASLAMLEELLTEFRFVNETDRAAALSAILTATVRPSLPHAPAFHVRAPSSGSGKSYLCDLIGAFSGPADNAKVSFPKTSEEATKVILSLLMKNPAVIEFDDMDGDWLPHGVINRALTAEHITDRILGFSKTATVSTRSLFLGSGNNVGPVRDLMRRVLTINIDPKCASPALISYSSNPVDTVRADREKYVSAALTIISAWKAAGSPRADIEPIVTYSRLWADYCRYPLIWLGIPDPATALLEQVKHDPDTDLLRALLVEWHKQFGSTPMTVRKILSNQEYHEELMDIIREFHVEERGVINRSKFGRVLKKNADRIVGEWVLRRAEADGRGAWQVVPVEET